MRTLILLFATVLSVSQARTVNPRNDKGFYVQGTKLFDANGKEFIIRGINHAHTWFKDQTPTAIKAIAETGANTIRVVLADGQKWQKDDKSKVEEIIKLCKKNKLIVVLEAHDATGSDQQQDLMNAASYFIELKDILVGNEAYVIINIANEWVGQWESNIWEQGYKNAISLIRMQGIKNTLMVDSAGWGQFPQSIVDKGNSVFASDPLHNTMFSTHMYGSAGGSEKQVKENIDKVYATQLCHIIGEFGWKHSDGDVDEETIMSYTTEKGIGYMAWSWKGNSGGVEYLDLTNDWEGHDLTDWGKEVVSGKNGLKETSHICSVYE